MDPPEGEDPPPFRVVRGAEDRPRGHKGATGGRFQALNAFGEGVMAARDRRETAAWPVPYRDCRDGVARTSLSEVARRGGMDRRTAQRAVRRLRKRGLVEVVRRGGLNLGPSSYRVLVPPAGG